MLLQDCAYILTPSSGVRTKRKTDDIALAPITLYCISGEQALMLMNDKSKRDDRPTDESNTGDLGLVDRVKQLFESVWCYPDPETLY
jgi:hypothetical protein